MKDVLAVLRSLLSMYSWRYPEALVYMLQNTEYRAEPYLKWYWQTTDFGRVMYRRTLDRTKAARLLLLALRAGIAAQIFAGLLVLVLWRWHHVLGGWEFGLALLVGYPVVWAHLVVVPLVAGRYVIAKPREARLVQQSMRIFADHKGVIIAIAGSYGKTSMKELLLTVLGEGKKIAATPANKNVAISHAYFAQKLKGDEDVLLIEYGEAAPGDVARFAAATHPTHAVITGLAPAHLDQYKTIAAAGADIFSLATAVPHDHVYVNAASPLTKKFIEKSFKTYDENGALGWRTGDVHVGIEGTSFTLRKEGRTLHLQSKLVGRHHIGPLSLAAALADELGLTPKQIEAGVAKTAPFEHRMQPYQLGGVWIIDDTYNGNIEGIRAGTALLKELPAARKVYVTPGLVDQGEETAAVHREMGRLIAASGADKVVLMQNSATPFIKEGLQAAHFRGEIIIETDPLSFYNNLHLSVAAGDLWLLQNDWTDNYL